MKHWYFIFLVAVLVSCKSKAVLVDSKPIEATTVIEEKKRTPEEIIKNHYSNKSDFSTLYIRSSARYKDEKQTQTVSAEIKIKKDEKILVSIRFLGITMAKALITPTEVKYYEKINGTYFEGNYEALSQWLGTDLDFNKIQNLLMGRPFDDMTKGIYVMEFMDNTYKLNVVENKTEKTFYFDGNRFLLSKQEIIQPEKERSFEAKYTDYQDFVSAFLPGNISINALQTKGKTAISIEYNSATFNEELSFPYSVPEGYERIFIN